MIPLSLLITTILATTASANTPTSAGAKFKELYGFGTSSPKLNAFPDQHLSRRLEGGKPTLTSNITTIKGVSTTAAVHWNDVEFTSAYDWIGMWPLTDTYPLFSAPIKFKFVCEECKKAASDPTNPNPPYPAPVSSQRHYFFILFFCFDALCLLSTFHFPGPVYPPTTFLFVTDLLPFPCTIGLLEWHFDLQHHQSSHPRRLYLRAWQCTIPGIVGSITKHYGGKPTNPTRWSLVVGTQ
jgi:hypothetical protein